MAMSTRTTSPQIPPHAALNQVLTASWISQAVSVAAELGIADIVNSGALTAAEIAKKVDANPDALYRILRALASVGVFRETRAEALPGRPGGTTLRTSEEEGMAAERKTPPPTFCGAPPAGHRQHLYGRVVAVSWCFPGQWLCRECGGAVVGVVPGERPRRNGARRVCGPA